VLYAHVHNPSTARPGHDPEKRQPRFGKIDLALAEIGLAHFCAPGKLLRDAFGQHASFDST
jgi:hypothetical protein